MKVYPTPGLQVRDPVTKHLLPQEGVEVPEGSLFYARRLRDGDVTLVQPTPVDAVNTTVKPGDNA